MRGPGMRIETKAGWRVLLAAGAALALAACGSSGVDLPQAEGALKKPDNIYIAEFDADAGMEVPDQALAAQLRRRMSGLTDDAIRAELARRAGAVVQEQIVASLRAGGLPAAPGKDQDLRIDQVTLVAGGKIRNADEARGRSTVRSRTRVAAEMKIVYITSGTTTKTLANIVAEDSGRGAAARNAPRQAGGAAEGFSPEMDAHLRRVGIVAADQILAFAAQQGWARPPAPASPPPQSRRR